MRILWLSAFLLLPAQAQAHAILIDGTPVAGSTLPAGPLVIHLRYNSRIDAGRSRLTLTDPAGVAHVLDQMPPDAPNLLEAKTPLSAGTWSLRWQVLATDGHITRGDIAFTVSAAP